VVKRINKNNQLAQVKLDETKQFRRKFVSILFQFLFPVHYFHMCDPFIFDKPVKMLMSLTNCGKTVYDLFVNFNFVIQINPQSCHHFILVQ